MGADQKDTGANMEEFLMVKAKGQFEQQIMIKDNPKNKIPMSP